MAIKIDIDSSSIFAAREAVRSLESEYSKLTDKISDLNSTAQKNNGLTGEQAQALKSYNAQLKEVNTELNQYNKLLDEVDPSNLTASFDDIYGAVKPLNTQIGELEDRLYELANRGQQNTEEFRNVSAEVGRLKGVIKETDREIDVMAANTGVSGLGEQFGLVGESLLRLDFKTATAGLNAMSANMAKINPKEIAGDLAGLGKAMGTTLVQGIKTAGNAFASFGKMLMANPIGPVIIAVGLLVVAIELLKDKIQLFGQIIEISMAPLKMVGKLLEWLIDGFNALTDAMGLTNVAEVKHAEERAKRAEKEEQRVTKEMDLKNMSLNRDIAILEAKGANTVEEIRQVNELRNQVERNEILKLEAEQKTVQAKINLLKTKKSLTDEEKQELKDLEDSLKVYAEKIKDGNSKIEINNIKTEQAITKKREDEAKKREDNAKKAADAKTKREEKEEQEKKKREEERAKADEFLAQMKIAQIQDEGARELAVLKRNLEKEKTEILKNTQLTQEEKAKIEEYYKALSDKADADYKKKGEEQTKADNAKKQDIINSAQDRLLKLKLDKMKEEADKSRQASEEYIKANSAAEIKAIEKQQKEELDKLVPGSEEYLAVKEYYSQLLIQKNDEEKKELEENNKKWDKIAEEERLAALKRMSDNLTKGFESANLGIGESMFNLTQTLTAGIDNMVTVIQDKTATMADKVSAVIGFGLESASAMINTISDINKQNMESQLTELTDGLAVQMGIYDEQLRNGVISQAQYDQIKYQLELEAFNRSEKLKEQAFEQDKKARIAQATIATIQGAIMAFMQSMQAFPMPAGPIIGAIMAAATTAMGVVQIANIKKQTYKAGTPPTPPKAPSIPSVNTGSGSNDSRTPNLKEAETGVSNEYGSGNNSINGSINVTATVDVSEISSKQDKMAKYEINNSL